MTQAVTLVTAPAAGTFARDTPQENYERDSSKRSCRDDSDDDGTQKDTINRNQFSPPTSLAAFAPLEAESHVAIAMRSSFCSAAVKPLVGTSSTT